MAREIPGFSFSRVAGADLSAKQYRFVKLDGTAQAIACAATTDRPIGILQNAPTSGQEAQVMSNGISKVEADAAIAIGDELGCSADGQAAVYVPGTDTTKRIVGIALSAASNAGELVSILFSCAAPARGA